MQTKFVVALIVGILASGLAIAAASGVESGWGGPEITGVTGGSILLVGLFRGVGALYEIANKIGRNESEVARIALELSHLSKSIGDTTIELTKHVTQTAQRLETLETVTKLRAIRRPQEKDGG